MGHIARYMERRKVSLERAGSVGPDVLVPTCVSDACLGSLGQVC